MSREKISGIYCIENTVNGKKYIGLSTDINKRWITHKWRLNKNSHENNYLQNAWNKYGENNFTFTVIKLLENEGIEILSELEKGYISKNKSNNKNFGYNICAGGEINILPREVIEKRSEKYSKRVAQFDADGNFIQVYLNARHASSMYGVDCSSIYQCCRGKIASSYGYIWMFVDKKDYVKNTNFLIADYPIKENKKVLSFNMNGMILREFDNCTHAQNEYNKGGDSIRLCCLGKNKTAYGMIWMYKEDFLKHGIDLEFRLSKTEREYNRDNSDKQKPVAMCDKYTSEILKIYKSARDASLDGFNYKNISQVCQGEKRTHKGYIWKFI